MKKGKGQVFYKLGSQFPVIAVVGLGKEGAGYNEEEDIDEGQENVRIGSAGMLSITSRKLLHYFVLVISKQGSQDTFSQYSDTLGPNDQGSIPNRDYSLLHNR